jgi:glycosyltransferase involved in cell wall biosynthesis
MITGRDFIFISSIEWGFLWQGHQEIASRLAAAGNRVLYIENMGVRAPGLGDASRIAGRLQNWARARRSSGVRQVAENIHVCSPIVCPPFGSKLRTTLNRRFFLPALKRAAEKLGFRNPIIWNYLPTDTSADLIRMLSSPRSVVVYHSVADFSQLVPQVELLNKSERDVLALSDLVLASCSQLATSAAQFNDHVYLTTHGVNLAAVPFADPLAAKEAPPVDLQGLPHPLIGYVGGIHRHVDLDLIREIALQRPDWTWVMIGSVQVPIDRLNNLPNVKLLGAKPHSELAGYIRHFDVCTVPYARTDSTATVVPTKLNEYLAVGRPVVATDLPTIQEFNAEHDVLNVAAANPESFIAALETALRSSEDAGLARRRRELAERADWNLQLERISELIEERIVQRHVSD